MHNEAARIAGVKRMLAIRNQNDNPMSNATSVAKMTETIKQQYANGRRPHNYRGR